MQFNSSLMKNLSDTFGPSGREKRISELVMKELEGFVDEIYIDVLGNVVAHKKGNGKKLMFSAHMDSIGLIITNIDDKGYLKFTNIGGISQKIIVGQKVVFENGLLGVIYQGKVANQADADISSMYIDVASIDIEFIKKNFKVGDMCIIKTEYYETDDCVMCQASDDRSGCYVLIEAAKQQKKSDFDVYYVFSVQEEVSVLGARVVGQNLAPDICIAVDVTFTGDTYQDYNCGVKLGAGAAISIKDMALLTHSKLLDVLISIAEKQNIKYQPLVVNIGMTDAGVVHKLLNGIPSSTISIPCRYMHSPGEVVNKNDMIEAVKFIIAIAEYSE